MGIWIRRWKRKKTYLKSLGRDRPSWRVCAFLCKLREKEKNVHYRIECCLRSHNCWGGGQKADFADFSVCMTFTPESQSQLPSILHFICDEKKNNVISTEVHIGVSVTFANRIV